MGRHNSRSELMHGASPIGLKTKDANGDEPNGNEETPTPNQEMKNAFAGFMKTFDTFSAGVTEEINQIKKSKSGDADPLTTEKLRKLNERLDQHQDEMKAAILAAKKTPLAVKDADGNALTDDQVKHKNAMNDFIRKGVEPADLKSMGIAALFGQKALSVGSDSEAGYLVPTEVDRNVGKLVKDISPIRSISQVRSVSGSNYKKPVQLGDAGSGWVGETSGRPETDTPELSLLDFPTMELYAMPAATQNLLDDSYVNIEQWLAEEVREVFAEQEGKAFVNGNGVNKPRGFLDYDLVANDSWKWGKLGYVATGVNGALPSTNPGDQVDPLIDLIYGTKASFRQNGRFVMNRKMQATIRKIKDADGNQIWQPNAQIGQPATLLGYGITEAEDMPDASAGSLSVAFGDFNRGYLIVDRIGIRVLRDPYSKKPYVLFYTTKRVGGGVQNFQAIKLLKFSAS